MRTRSGKALIFILLGCSLLSVVLGVGAAMLLTRKAAAAPEKHHKKSKDGEESTVEPKTVYSLGEMVINLADQDTLRYAKLSVAVGFEEKLSEEQIKEFEPIMKDSVVGVVSAQTFKELHTAGGLKRLKGELTDSLAERMEKHPVATVYLEGFAMQ
jgi:flagellar FliL protein